MASAGTVAAGVAFLMLGMLLLWYGFSTLIETLLFVLGVVLIVAGFAQARKGRLTAI